jgi:hypothetical protein
MPHSEARLSQLCRWVLDADHNWQCYGLRLPAWKSPSPAAMPINRVVWRRWHALIDPRAHPKRFNRASAAMDARFLLLVLPHAARLLCDLHVRGGMGVAHFLPLRTPAGKCRALVSPPRWRCHRRSEIRTCWEECRCGSAVVMLALKLLELRSARTCC